MNCSVHLYIQWAQVYAYVPARMFTFSTFMYIHNTPMLVQVVYIKPLFWWYISRIHTPLCKSPIFSFDSGQNIARLSRIMELHLGSAQGGFLCEISPLPPRRVKLLHFRPQASKNGVFTRQLVYIYYIWIVGYWVYFAYIHHKLPLASVLRSYTCGIHHVTMIYITFLHMYSLYICVHKLCFAQSNWVCTHKAQLPASYVAPWGGLAALLTARARDAAAGSSGVCHQPEKQEGLHGSALCSSVRGKLHTHKRSALALEMVAS